MEDFKKQIREYKKKIKQLEETCDILADTEVMRSIHKSLEDIKAGRVHKIEDL